MHLLGRVSDPIPAFLFAAPCLSHALLKFGIGLPRNNPARRRVPSGACLAVTPPDPALSGTPCRGGTGRSSCLVTPCRSYANHEMPSDLYDFPDVAFTMILWF